MGSGWKSKLSTYRMCCLRCTLHSQMELSAGREIYESGYMMQTQRGTFVVLIQCGNANHTEKKPVHHLTTGTISQTVSAGRWSWDSAPHLRQSTECQLQRQGHLQSHSSAPGPRGSQSKRPPLVTSCLPSWPWPRSITISFAYLLFVNPNVSFVRAEAYRCPLSRFPSTL